VSVPAWNSARFLPSTLDSVYAQRVPADEILVIDDGSTDDTATVVGRHPKVRYVRQDNAGPSAARNHGARLARGSLLAFLDADDRWEPEYLERTVDHLGRHPAVGLVMPAVRYITADGRPTSHVRRKRHPGDRYTFASLLTGDAGTIVNPVIRREPFRAVGGYDESMRTAEDCDLWIRLAAVTELAYLPEPLLLYRVHPGSLSGNVLANARAWLHLLDKIERDQPALAREHRPLLVRARGKEMLRLGRELLARSSDDPTALSEARAALRESSRLGGRRGKALLYRALAAVPPLARAYGSWRRAELGAIGRLVESRARRPRR